MFCFSSNTFVFHPSHVSLFSKSHPIKLIRYSIWKLESKCVDSLANHIDLSLREKIFQWANIGWLIRHDIPKLCHIHYCIILILKTLIGIEQCISVIIKSTQRVYYSHCGVNSKFNWKMLKGSTSCINANAKRGLFDMKSILSCHFVKQSIHY